MIATEQTSPTSTNEDFPECEHLSGRMKQICRGESGLPLNGQNSTNSYRTKLWQLTPLPSQAVGPSPQLPQSFDRDRAQREAFPCVHRSKDPIDTDTSNLCGSRGDQVNIFACGLGHTDGKCSIARYCQHQTVQACNRCSDRKSPEVAPTPRRRRSRSPFTVHHGTPQYISKAQLMDDVEKLKRMLPADTARIVGVSRSGLVPATMVAMMLHLPMEIVRESEGDIIDAGNGWRLNGKANGGVGSVVVIDDNVMTGNSLKKIKPIVQAKYPHAIFAAVYVNPEAHTHPDLYVKHLKWPTVLEWNLFNAVLTKSLAVDFDGILCEDCPPGSDDDGERYLDFLRNTKPLYVMRKDPIPLIVTARLEKYRGETEAWLSRHGMRADRLIMGPWKSLAERYRDPNAVADFKATHFANFMKERHRMRPVMFVESEERQARRIAEVSRGIVVCPAAGRCFPYRVTS